MGRDSQWFAALFQAHCSAVCRYIAARAEPDVVEDVAADTFMVAWRRRDELPDQLRPWLPGTAAITIPGASPDVIAHAAAALGDSAGGGITFSGLLRYGDDGDTGNAVRVEGSQKGAVGPLGVHGGVPGIDEARSLGSRLTFFQVALSELRELLERAGADEDDSVRVLGGTTVAGRNVYELRVDPQDGASWTLYGDRQDYLLVRFENATPVAAGRRWTSPR